MHNLINSLIETIDKYTNYDFYIGQTNNPRERLRQHKQSKNFNFMIVIYKSSKEIIDILEYSLINKYKSYANNMNNQSYDNNLKVQIDNSIQIPDINDIEELHYLYIAFPFVIKVLTDYIDLLNVKVDENNKIKITSILNYSKKKSNVKTVKTPREICENKIKTLVSQYHYKYRFMKIRSTNKDFKTFKAIKENKNYMIKMIYKNSDSKLINELKKEFQNTEYENIINLKESKIKSLFHRSNKDDKLYIAFIN